jgi:hypothetical protein
MTSNARGCLTPISADSLRERIEGTVLPFLAESPARQAGLAARRDSQSFANNGFASLHSTLLPITTNLGDPPHTRATHSRASHLHFPEFSYGRSSEMPGNPGLPRI